MTPLAPSFIPRLTAAAVLCLALSTIAAALPAHAFVSLGVGVSTGNAHFGVSTYTPIYLWDAVFTPRPVRCPSPRRRVVVRPAYIPPPGVRRVRWSGAGTPKAQPPHYRPVQAHQAPAARPRGHSGRGYAAPRNQRGYSPPGVSNGWTHHPPPTYGTRRSPPYAAPGVSPYSQLRPAPPPRRYPGYRQYRSYTPPGYYYPDNRNRSTFSGRFTISP